MEVKQMIDTIMEVAAKAMDKIGEGGKILMAHSEEIKRGTAVITSGLAIGTAIRKLKNAMNCVEKDPIEIKVQKNVETKSKKGLDGDYSEQTMAVIQ